MQGQIIEHVRRVMKLQWEEGDVDRLARAFDVSQGPGFATKGSFEDKHHASVWVQGFYLT